MPSCSQCIHSIGYGKVHMKCHGHSLTRGSDIRVSSSPAVKSNGAYFDISHVDSYLGAYQSDRQFFSGSSSATAGSSFGWLGTPNNSISVRNDRISIVSRPAGAQLPNGISWAQVGADAALVSG